MKNLSSITPTTLPTKEMPSAEELEAYKKQCRKYVDIGVAHENLTTFILLGTGVEEIGDLTKANWESALARLAVAKNLKALKTLVEQAPNTFRFEFDGM
jgi:hypothetical protein